MIEYRFTLHFIDSSEILVVYYDENKKDDFIRWICSNEGTDRKWCDRYMVNRNNVCHVQYGKIDVEDTDAMLKRFAYGE